jgi:hypothetical protein
MALLRVLRLGGGQSAVWTREGEWGTGKGGAAAQNWAVIWNDVCTPDAKERPSHGGRRYQAGREGAEEAETRGCVAVGTHDA